MFCLLAAELYTTGQVDGLCILVIADIIEDLGQFDKFGGRVKANFTVFVRGPVWSPVLKKLVAVVAVR